MLLSPSDFKPSAKEVKKRSALDRAALIEQINIPQLSDNLFDSSCRGNHSNLTELLTPPTKNLENLRYEAIQEHHLLQVRNDQTRTCLDLASMLGHHDAVKVLAEKGEKMIPNGINVSNGMGYSSLHLACVWNQVEAVRCLIALGGDIEQRTQHGERPIDIAQRYHHDELTDYLRWIAIRNTLTRMVAEAKEFLLDPAKHLNRLSKDEKKRLDKYISETSKWFEENQHVDNAQELFSKRIEEAEAFFRPFYANAVPETDVTSLGITHPSRAQLGTPKTGRR